MRALTQARGTQYIGTVIVSWADISTLYARFRGKDVVWPNLVEKVGLSADLQC